VASALSVVCALVLAPGAVALDGSQAEYRSKAETICAANGDAAKRIGVGLRPTEKGEGGRPNALAESGRRFVRASKALSQTVTKLRAIPRPEPDAQLLARWLGQVSDQASLLRDTGMAAIDGKASRAQKLINQTANGSRRANAIVVAYEFRHCVLKEAGFTP
jgi:hypothetical protein